MPTGVYVKTEEHKRNLSKARLERRERLGYINSPEARRNISKGKKGQMPWNKGKVGLQVAWNKGKVGLQVAWNKGKKGWIIPWNKGKTGVYSEETIRKISKGWFKKGQYAGKNHPQWQGGISFEPYSISWTETLREAIRQRDNYVCQLCNKAQGDELKGFNLKLSVHHIDYDKNNLAPDNLISLCRSCHMKTNYKREHWKQHFRQVNKGDVNLIKVISQPILDAIPLR